MEGRKPRLRMVIDSDRVYLDTLQSDPLNERFPFIFLPTGREAQQQLANTKLPLAAIFVNPALSDGYGISVLRFSHLHHPATPLYLLQETDTKPFTERELFGLGVQGYVRKPKHLNGFVEYPKAVTATFDPKLALAISQKNSDQVDMEINISDAAFVPILAENFVSGTISFFDIYVKLSTKRYIKILKAGDSFTEDRVKSYLQKGVTHFFLRRESQEMYLGYCEKLSQSLNKKDNVAPKVQVAFSMNHGQEVMNFLRHSGVNSSSLEYAHQFVDNVQTLISKTRPKENPYLDEFLANVAAYDHAVGVTVIASVLGQALGMTSGNPLQIIGMAGMFHDIGLLQLPEELQQEDESKMNEEEKQLYRTHPTLGMEIIRNLQDVHPTAAQAVLQHHERRNKSGFPQQLGLGSINGVSEIISLSNEFSLAVKKLSDQEDRSGLNQLLLHLLDWYSPSVGETFKKVFNLEKT